MSRTVTVAGIAVVALVAIGVAVYLLRPAAETGNTATSAQRGDEARTLIADLQKGGKPDYEQAYQRAEQFQKNGQLADAQLLYFYAARGGHAPSAFALATMNDPNHHSAATSLLPKPAPFQAYKWYTAALEHGSDQAADRLEELHEWAKNEAAHGNMEAQQLLLQWQ